MGIILQRKEALGHGFAIVVDIGKTLSKVTLWSREGEMLHRQVRRNSVAKAGGIGRLDVSGIAAWLERALAVHAGEPIEFLVPVGHGAGVAAIVSDRLAFAPIDYEQPLGEEVARAYRRERDPFALTGSPALPDGLNMGAQLYWLERRDPRLLEHATLLPWPQYWAWFLSGNAVSEVTSLGCHTDLWNPADNIFSPMAQRFGWADRFAPIAAAGDVIGTLRPDLAKRTGLPASAKVLAGLHDSNAALLSARGFAEIADEEATVLSTGTWFIAMRLTEAAIDLGALPATRDCLVNVDPFGRPVPSARFMGGREIEAMIELDRHRIDIRSDQPALLAALPQALFEGSMMLPTLAPGCGPFPQGKARWIGKPKSAPRLRAVASLYAALVADTALDLIGSRRALLVEGRFAGADVFVRALAALRPDMAVYTAGSESDVSFGALRLIDAGLDPRTGLASIEPLEADLPAYRARWLAEIAGNQAVPLA